MKGKKPSGKKAKHDAFAKGRGGVTFKSPAKPAAAAAASTATKAKKPAASSAAKGVKQVAVAKAAPSAAAGGAKRVVKTVVRRRAAAPATKAKAPSPKQSPRASPKQSPRASPKQSPRASPKQSPRASPKQSPAAAPSSPKKAPLKSALKSALKKRPAQPAQAPPAPQEPKKRKQKRIVVEAEEEPKKDTLLIVAGTYDSSVGGWMYKEEEEKVAWAPVFAVKPHHGYVSTVAQSDKWMLSGGSDEQICVFNAKKMTEVGSCGSEGTPTTMHIIDGNALVCTATGLLQILRTQDWFTIWKEQGHRRRIHDIAIHKALGITVGDDSFLKLWNFSTCKLVLQVKLPKPASFVRFLSSGEGYILATHPKVTLHDLDGNEQGSTTLPAEAHCCAVYDGPSNTFVFGLEDGSFHAVTASNGKIAAAWSMKAHPSRVKAISISTNPDDGRVRMASVCTAGSLMIWRCDGSSQPSLCKEIKQSARFTAVSAAWR